MRIELVRRPLRATIAGAALALLLVGCTGITPPIGTEPVPDPAPGASDENANTGGNAPDATGGGVPVVLTLTGQSFTFDVTCMISPTDILIFGPGKDDDSGEPAYLSVDLTEVDGARWGEIRIDLGTDQQFVSSDSIYTSQINQDHEYGIMYNTGQTIIESQYRAQAPIGTGTLVAECD